MQRAILELLSVEVGERIASVVIALGKNCADPTDKDSSAELLEQGIQIAEPWSISSKWNEGVEAGSKGYIDRA